MDEIIAFIIIWIVLYLVNQFTKKIKKEETGKTSQTKPQSKPSSSIPPLWESQQPEYPPSPLPTVEEKEYEEEFFEEESDELNELEEEKEKKLDTTEKIEEVEKNHIDSFKTDEISPKPMVIEKLVKVKSRLNLKEYIIWKEILDKPVSLRHKKIYQINRIS